MPDSFGSHPVVACAARLSGDLAEIAEVPVELMGTSDKAEALVAVSRVLDQLQALRLRLLAAADDVATEAGARDAGAWLAHRTRTERREQQSDQRLGTALTQRWQQLGAALAAGAVNLAQARVITHALEALPADVPAEVVTRAEAQLVAYAAEFGPVELRVLGRRVLDVVAPEVGEAAEARALEAEEHRAAEHTTLTLTPCGDGTTRLRGLLPDAAAHRLAAYLDAFTSPRRHHRQHGESGPVEPGPVHRRRGQAFCALLEHLDPKKLPDHGGEATTVMITMTLDQLRSELAAAGIISSDDLHLSAGQLRRLACTADLIPVVLGGASEILDLGHTSRLYKKAQRKAMRLRDHHHRAHDPTYDTSRRPDGDLEFHRRKAVAA